MGLRDWLRWIESQPDARDNPVIGFARDRRVAQKLTNVFAASFDATTTTQARDGVYVVRSCRRLRVADLFGARCVLFGVSEGDAAGSA